MPRTTVKRKLARLKKMGAVEQRGSRLFEPLVEILGQNKGHFAHLHHF
jgi:DNA-binding IclR family transcriptional regulator